MMQCSRYAKPSSDLHSRKTVIVTGAYSHALYGFFALMSLVLVYILTFMPGYPSLRLPWLC